MSEITLEQVHAAMIELARGKYADTCFAIYDEQVDGEWVPQCEVNHAAIEMSGYGAEVLQALCPWVDGDADMVTPTMSCGQWETLWRTAYIQLDWSMLAYEYLIDYENGNV